VEGGSCNDYEYVCGDPVNGFDLDGREYGCRYSGTGRVRSGAFDYNIDSRCRGGARHPNISIRIYHNGELVASDTRRAGGNQPGRWQPSLSARCHDSCDGYWSVEYEFTYFTPKKKIITSADCRRESFGVYCFGTDLYKVRNGRIVDSDTVHRGLVGPEDRRP